MSVGIFNLNPKSFAGFHLHDLFLDKSNVSTDNLRNASEELLFRVVSLHRTLKKWSHNGGWLSWQQQCAQIKKVDFG